jgi:Holliday junction DNA helicase RuvA
VIASLEGIVGSVGPESLVLEVGGVGYRVFASAGTLAGTRQGSKVKLQTHHIVREDSQALYGFRTTEERAFFELLMTVTGVGPKVALGITGSRPVVDLQLAIFQADEGVLTAVSGVGKKLAARIVLELKEKVAAAGTAGGVAAAGGPAGTGVSESEVIAALQALGYHPSEARDAARSAAASGSPGDPLEERVKSALRLLRRD